MSAIETPETMAARICEHRPVALAYVYEAIHARDEQIRASLLEAADALHSEACHTPVSLVHLLRAEQVIRAFAARLGEHRS